MQLSKLTLVTALIILPALGFAADLGTAQQDKQKGYWIKEDISRIREGDKIRVDDQLATVAPTSYIALERLLIEKHAYLDGCEPALVYVNKRPILVMRMRQTGRHIGRHQVILQNPSDEDDFIKEATKRGLLADTGDKTILTLEKDTHGNTILLCHCEEMIDTTKPAVSVDPDKFTGIAGNASKKT